MPVGKDGNESDRKLGEYWEDRFCEIARRFGWEAYPFQRKRGATFKSKDGKRFICPDVWILKRGKKQYAVEVKHKTVSRKTGGYGFEDYRARSLLDLQKYYSNKFGPVVCLYVVHNWFVAAGEAGKNAVGEAAERIESWFCQRLDKLQKHAVKGQEKTYYNGRVSKKKTDIWYYKHSFFEALEKFLK